MRKDRLGTLAAESMTAPPPPNDSPEPSTLQADEAVPGPGFKSALDSKSFNSLQKLRPVPGTETSLVFS